MPDLLRVGVVGTGYFSQFHFDAWSRCPEVDLVALASLDAVSANRVASKHEIAGIYDSCAAMLQGEKLDLLDIITPPQTHLELIELAASHGVDVICQKPFCGDADTAARATKIAAEAGIKLIVHENFRFQPWYQAIKQVLDSGRLGEIYQATFRLRPGDGQGADAYLERQPYFQQMPRFLVHETAIHLIDVARYLLGHASAVWADLRRLNPAIKGEDAGIIVLYHANGLRSVIDGNRLSDHPAENRRRTMGELLIEGENAVLSLDGDGRIFLRSHGSNDEEPIAFDWRDQGFGGDCVYRFTRHVVDHYAGGLPLVNQANDYLVNQAIEEAVYVSAESGCKVVL